MTNATILNGDFWCRGANSTMTTTISRFDVAQVNIFCDRTKNERRLTRIVNQSNSKIVFTTAPEPSAAERF